MAVNIPNRYREGLAILADLDDASSTLLYEALKQSPNGIVSQADLTSDLIQRTKAVDPAKIRKIVYLLSSLYQVRRRMATTSEKLASDILSASQREGITKIQGEKAAAEFKNRLAQFLNLESLDVLTTKAAELQGDVERALCDARVLTDLRPIFADEVDTPRGMIVVHTLKLGYHDTATGKHEELFVAIDDQDITKLKSILERAEKKAKILIAKLRDSGIKTVDLSKEVRDA